MTATSHCEIRPLQQGDRPAVSHLLRQSFAALKLPFLPNHPPGFVAEQAGLLCGVIVVNQFSLDAQRQAGTILVLATAPSVRGQGIGQQLVEAALDWFASEGCSQIFTCVEGHNTSSSQMFATRGFATLSLPQQLQQYGWQLPYLWYKTGHISDLGHFLWRSPALPQPSQRSHGLGGWCTTTLLGNSAIVALMAARRGSDDLSSPPALILLVAIVALVLGLRTAGMALAGRWRQVQLRHYPWESGSLISVGLALCFGVYFPVPGNSYPAVAVWRYRDWRVHLGWVALGGILPVLLVAYGSTLGLTLLPAGAATPWLELTQTTSISLLFWDSLLPIYPFDCFNSGRLWRWHRGLWAVMAALTLAVFGPWVSLFDRVGGS